MANARQVKGRISTAKNISKITKAMEMVSASKMKRAQDQATSARPYAEALSESLKKVCAVVDSSVHPLLSNHQEGMAVVVLISTDKGLCGNLNGYLYKELLNWKNAQKSDYSAIVVGKKGVAVARSLGIDIFAQFTDLPEKVTIKEIVPLTTIIMDNFLDHNFKSVDVIYTDFINTLSQRPKIDQVLPVSSKIEAIKPLKNEENIEVDKKEIQKKKETEYLFEPNPVTILDRLLPFYVENSIFHAFLESRASEHSARMVAMKNASENASDLVDELQLIYNKSRQQSITGELLDITTATLTLE